MSTSMCAPESARDLLVEPSVDCGAALAQLAIVHEMLAMLETVTAAGQCHLMGKILALLQKHVTRATAAVSPRNLRPLLDLIERLAQISERSWPDVHGFTDRARDLVTLLAAIS